MGKITFFVFSFFFNVSYRRLLCLITYNNNFFNYFFFETLKWEAAFPSPLLGLRTASVEVGSHKAEQLKLEPFCFIRGVFTAQHRDHWWTKDQYVRPENGILLFIFNLSCFRGSGKYSLSRAALGLQTVGSSGHVSLGDYFHSAFWSFQFPLWCEFIIHFRWWKSVEILFSVL